MVERSYGRTDEDVVSRAIRNGADTIHDISIGTGLEYAKVVRIVLNGLASKRFRLVVIEEDSGQERLPDGQRDAAPVGRGSG